MSLGPGIRPGYGGEQVKAGGGLTYPAIDRPNTMRPSERISRNSARPVVLFPDPDSPTKTQRFAWMQGETDIVNHHIMIHDALQNAFADREGDAQPVHLQQRRLPGGERNRIACGFAVE
ncbi:Uncharacterised protein [Salmonella enterica subsp. enterica]|uniref:Uncharacterized protein n=1 Tax=Salmonella enterica I TaxID=59201 RepID=A0A379WQI2_SALET|nr:Uncharacterised protein [Salmonella enterica subsp. enterica]